MPCGKIMNVTKEKPKTMKGKTYKWVYNPKNKTYVKIKTRK